LAIYRTLRTGQFTLQDISVGVSVCLGSLPISLGSVVTPNLPWPLSPQYIIIPKSE